MRYLMILTMALALTSCDNPFRHLKPDESSTDEKIALKYKTDTKLSRPMLVPGFDKEVKEEELDQYVEPIGPKKAEDPREGLKRFITLLAKVACGIGFVMLLAGAVAFIYKAPVWDDLVILGVILFGGGVSVAVSYALVTIVAPIISCAMIGYVIYTVYKNHKTGKAVDDLVDSFDYAKNVTEWTDEAKKKVSELQNGAKKHVDLSKARRERDRERKAKVEAMLAATKG